MNIGESVKKFRLAHNMEQQELADRLNVSNKTISSWECGRTEPKMGFVEEMCNIFNCTKSDFLDGVLISPHNIDSEEMELIRIYRGLNETGQKKIIDYAHDLDGNGAYSKKNSSYKVVSD